MNLFFSQIKDVSEIGQLGEPSCGDTCHPQKRCDIVERGGGVAVFPAKLGCPTHVYIKNSRGCERPMTHPYHP